MQNQTARTAAQIGAAALLVSMIFPWFGHDFGQIDVDYDVWHDARPLAIGLGAFALVCLSQIQFGGPGTMGRVWLFLGGGLAAYLAFRIFTPPKDPVSEMLDAMQLTLHARPGAYVALAGSVMIAYAGWIEIKNQQIMPGRAEVLGTGVAPRVAPPVGQPAAYSTAQPTAQPTAGPTAGPTVQPAVQPTARPTVQPHVQPAAQPVPPAAARPRQPGSP